MAFVVETGSGLPNANSLTLVQTFRDFFSDRGTDTSSFTDTEVEYALIKGTDFISNHYRGAWRGQRVKGTQSLPFPRQNLYDQDGFLLDTTIVPDRVQYAVSVTSKRLLDDATLNLQPDVNRTDYLTKLKVDVIELEFEEDLKINPVPIYTEINEWLSGYLTMIPNRGVGIIPLQRA